MMTKEMRERAIARFKELKSRWMTELDEDEAKLSTAYIAMYMNAYYGKGPSAKYQYQNAVTAYRFDRWMMRAEKALG